MSNRPDLAICMPVYNAEKTITRTIKQILSQTYQDFQLIITDDKSTDNTFREIRIFDDPRILLISNSTNLGAPATRNNMLEYCIENGYKFMALMDADDEVNPDRIEKQLSILRSDPSLAVCGSSMFVTKTGKVWHAPTTPYEIKTLGIFGNPIPTSTATLSLRHMQLHNLRWRPSSVPCADYQLWAEMLFTHNLRAANTGDVDMIYNYSSDGVSHRHGINKQELKDAEVKKYILSHFGIKCESRDLAGFTQVALCRSSQQRDAESFLYFCNQLLEKNNNRIVEDKLLRQQIRHRAFVYLSHCTDMHEQTRHDIMKLISAPQFVLFFDVGIRLLRFKRSVLDNNFPRLSKFSGITCHRIRKPLSKARKIISKIR